MQHCTSVEAAKYSTGSQQTALMHLQRDLQQLSEKENGKSR